MLIHSSLRHQLTPTPHTFLLYYNSTTQTVFVQRHSTTEDAFAFQLISLELISLSGVKSVNIAAIKFATKQRVTVVPQSTSWAERNTSPSSVAACESELELQEGAVEEESVSIWTAMAWTCCSLTQTLQLGRAFCFVVAFSVITHRQTGSVWDFFFFGIRALCKPLPPAVLSKMFISELGHMVDLGSLVIVRQHISHNEQAER